MYLTVLNFNKSNTFVSWGEFWDLGTFKYNVFLAVLTNTESTTNIYFLFVFVSCELGMTNQEKKSLREKLVVCERSYAIRLWKAVKW